MPIITFNRKALSVNADCRFKRPGSSFKIRNPYKGIGIVSIQIQEFLIRFFSLFKFSLLFKLMGQFSKIQQSLFHWVFPSLHHH